MTHHQRTCAVEVSPCEVDAGAELTVTVRASCPDGCDLTGQSVSLRDQNGAELATVELTALDGQACVTSAVVLRAPIEVGEHIYRAVLAAHEKDRVWHDETEVAFCFTAKAHMTYMNVWGVPSAIAASERFRFSVGVKCSAGCKLTGTPVSVFDHEGGKVGAGVLLEEVWPGTDALYFAELEARAPLAIGDYRWQTTIPASDAGVPHEAGSSAFGVKVVDLSNYQVTVEAFDSEKQAPISGAHVLLHPYRAFTDAAGVARVKVAKGRYRLFVSGFNYIPYENTIDVANDLVHRVELTAEP